MENRENEITKLMEEKLVSYGFTKNDLTKEELSELREEVIAELNGQTIIDGVLFYIPRYGR